MPVTLTRLQWFYFPKVFLFIYLFLTQNHIERCHLSREPKSHQLPVCLTKNLPAVLCDHFRDTALKVSTAVPHRVLFKPSVRKQQAIRGWWP